ncbi:hypothetical protein [Streptomyces scabiei]|uniref:hypothetical protein n=1 Tax=Streptomyces scabiei TaxID=1930 RepID=UPI000A88A9EC|nr:hypothetical protein [Streptomyces scabiei]
MDNESARPGRGSRTDCPGHQYIGKAGVLRLAPRTGLGVTDSQARARVGEGRLRLFRR